MKISKIQLDDSMWKGANSGTFKKAQILREDMTNSETLLWNKLKDKRLLGCKIRRQHPIGIYIVDFYIHKYNLVIEVDGEYHDKQEQIIKDKERTNFLEFNGLKVIRFKNKEVENDILSVINQIRNEIEK
ncbi:Very-short-patch-repair endonuclease [Lutibacter agarilyticus]|uniref:Very-short-patch-repair endonuclease n=1 Tax=Lutibacter agarilyticus TaxID=1109740 RepID=A0A238YXQ7_9FLAO|nr:endonuclease domain-containing protein [Lutibacter agarilyticus]SNR75792.1 Very-short-patch-repair endonuclease [Lutibacter agarilyticus]